QARVDRKGIRYADCRGRRRTRCTDAQGRLLQEPRGAGSRVEQQGPLLRPRPEQFSAAVRSARNRRRRQSSRVAPSCNRYATIEAEAGVMAPPRPTWRSFVRGLTAEAAADVPSLSSESEGQPMSKIKRVDAPEMSATPNAAAHDLISFSKGHRFAT